MSRSGKNSRRRLLRLAVGIVVVATGIRAWVGPTSWVPTVQAQIPNAGDQRERQVRELQRTNQLLNEILQTLKTQTLKVELGATDKKDTGTGRPQGTGDLRDR